MAELIKFEVKRLPKLYLVGKEIRHSMGEQMKGTNPLPAFWDKCFADEIFAPLEEQKDYIYDDSYVGIMVDWDKGDGNFSYIVGMFMKDGVSVPEKYYVKAIDEADIAIGWIKGKDAADVCSIAHEKTEHALKEQGYGCNNMSWCGEVYNCPRFTQPDESGELILDYYIPIDIK